MRPMKRNVVVERSSRARRAVLLQMKRRPSSESENLNAPECCGFDCVPVSGSGLRMLFNHFAVFKIFDYDK